MVLAKNPQLQGNQKQKECIREEQVHNVLKLITQEERERERERELEVKSITPTR